MKKTFRSVRSFTLAAMALPLATMLMACAATPASPDAAKAAAATTPTGGQSSVPGGFTNQDPNSDFIKEAATQAATLLASRTGDPTLSLVSVISAATQVVAGTNYRLTLSVATKSGTKQVNVLMYRDLQGNYSLSSVDGI